MRKNEEGFTVADLISGELNMLNICSYRTHPVTLNCLWKRTQRDLSDEQYIKGLKKLQQEKKVRIYEDKGRCYIQFMSGSDIA